MESHKRWKVLGVLAALGATGLSCALILAQRTQIRNQERMSNQIEELNRLVHRLTKYPERADRAQSQLSQQIQGASRALD